MEHGTGNVFADLGLPDAEEMQTKVRLAVRILESIEARGLTQAQAAELVGLKQPDISNLRRARLNNFTLDRLLRILRRLGYTVQLQVSEEISEEAHLLVLA
ncbi:MAG: helix-turn-helix transcriptional regulator [Burkholderiaceae bacterium]